MILKLDGGLQKSVRKDWHLINRCFLTIGDRVKATQTTNFWKNRTCFIIQLLEFVSLLPSGQVKGKCSQKLASGCVSKLGSLNSKGFPLKCSFFLDFGAPIYPMFHIFHDLIFHHLSYLTEGFISKISPGPGYLQDPLWRDSQVFFCGEFWSIFQWQKHEYIRMAFASMLNRTTMEPNFDLFL